MKKTILTLITAMLTIGAMAQVNAVGIPFGMGKYEARQLLRSKYGEPAVNNIDMIMYTNFRLDGVTYETASFHFNDDMKFTSASFSRPDQPTAADVGVMVDYATPRVQGFGWKFCASITLHTASIGVGFYM